jgi:hypothetical protein
MKNLFLVLCLFFPNTLFAQCFYDETVVQILDVEGQEHVAEVIVYNGTTLGSLKTETCELVSEKGIEAKVLYEGIINGATQEPDFVQVFVTPGFYTDPSERTTILEKTRLIFKIYELAMG